MIDLGRKLKSPAVAALVAGAGMYGFSKGFSSQGAVDKAYESMTGDPNIDEYVLGRNASFRQLLIPFPGSAVKGMSPVRDTGIGAAVGGLGLGGVSGIIARKSGRGALATMGISLATGIMGAGAGGYAGFSASTQGYVNPTTFRDAYKAQGYNNNMPMVDGSIVLGAYNSRMGGY